MDIISESTWGFEIEGGCDDYDGIKLSELGFEMGIDGSVRYINTIHDHCEIKTKGYFEDNKVIKKLNNFIEYLNEIKYVTNESCGIHIHIGNLEIGQIMKLIKFMIDVEPIIFKLFPERLKSDYTGTLKHNCNRFVKKFNKIPINLLEVLSTKEQLKKIMEDNTPYSGGFENIFYRDVCTNLRSYFDNNRKTIEFRCFPGNYNHLTYYTDLLDKIVYLIKRNNIYNICNSYLLKINRTKEEEKLNILFDILGISKESKMNLLSGIKIETQESEETILDAA
ncbi:MAG: amidoligase family protein [archaeon]